MEEIKPFEFRQCITIIKATGKKAKTLREFKDRIADASDESISHHVYHYFQKEKRILEYTNDFAQWAGETLKENILAEQLSNVDPYSFKSVNDLRDEIVGVIDAYLKTFSKTRAVLSGDEFYFNEGVTLVSPVGMQVKNLAEFLIAIRYAELESIYYHFYEARLRPPVEVDDFSHWFGDALNKTGLADRIRSIDPFMHSLEAARQHIIELVEDELKNDMEKF
ncbi:MAG: hypothetical protein FJ240_07595 [Nitrospira sp.]|nr:hypothetical protein [Nitrospira sp.]